MATLIPGNSEAVQLQGKSAEANKVFTPPTARVPNIKPTAKTKDAGIHESKSQLAGRLEKSHSKVNQLLDDERNTSQTQASLDALADAISLLSTLGDIATQAENEADPAQLARLQDNFSLIAQSLKGEPQANSADNLDFVAKPQPTVNKKASIFHIPQADDSDDKPRVLFDTASISSVAQALSEMKMSQIDQVKSAKEMLLGDDGAMAQLTQAHGALSDYLSGPLLSSEALRTELNHLSSLVFNAKMTEPEGAKQLESTTAERMMTVKVLS